MASDNNVTCWQHREWRTAAELLLPLAGVRLLRSGVRRVRFVVLLMLLVLLVSLLVLLRPIRHVSVWATFRWVRTK